MGLAICLTLILLTTTLTVKACPPSDQAALQAIKAALYEPSLGIFDTWTGNDCNAYYGVSCDPVTDRVAEISLRGESEDIMLQKTGGSGFMSGSLSPAICDLDQLNTLAIADWKGISGEIPACLTSLSGLQFIDLAGNNISGEVPSDIGKLNKLTFLSLSDNVISLKAS